MSVVAEERAGGAYVEITAKTDSFMRELIKTDQAFAQQKKKIESNPVVIQADAKHFVNFKDKAASATQGLSAAFSGLSDQQNELTSGLAKYSGLMGGLMSCTSVWGAISFAAGGLITLISSLCTKTAEFKKEMTDLRKQNESGYKDDASDMERLVELQNKQLSGHKLTNSELIEAIRLTTSLKAKYGDIGIGIDEVTGKISLMNDAQKKLNKIQNDRRAYDIDKEVKEHEQNIDALTVEKSKVLYNYIDDDAGYTGWVNYKYDEAEKDEKYQEVQAKLKAEKEYIEGLKQEKAIITNPDSETDNRSAIAAGKSENVSQYIKEKTTTPLQKEIENIHAETEDLLKNAMPGQIADLRKIEQDRIAEAIKGASELSEAESAAKKVRQAGMTEEEKKLDDLKQETDKMSTAFETAIKTGKSLGINTKDLEEAFKGLGDYEKNASDKIKTESAAKKQAEAETDQKNLDQSIDQDFKDYEQEHEAEIQEKLKDKKDKIDAAEKKKADAQIELSDAESIGDRAGKNKALAKIKSADSEIEKSKKDYANAEYKIRLEDFKEASKRAKAVDAAGTGTAAKYANAAKDTARSKLKNAESAVNSRQNKEEEYNGGNENMQKGAPSFGDIVKRIESSINVTSQKSSAGTFSAREAAGGLGGTNYEQQISQNTANSALALMETKRYLGNILKCVENGGLG